MNIYSLLDFEKKMEKKLKIGNKGNREKTSSFGVLKTRKNEKYRGKKKTFRTNIRKEIIFLNLKNRKRVKKPQKSSCS
jgi:NDP-sugar pyrophosphorylase family protein